jgi:hypothetical protein
LANQFQGIANLVKTARNLDEQVSDLDEVAANPASPINSDPESFPGVQIVDDCPWNACRRRLFRSSTSRVCAAARVSPYSAGTTFLVTEPV